MILNVQQNFEAGHLEAVVPVNSPKITHVYVQLTNTQAAVGIVIEPESLHRKKFGMDASIKRQTLIQHFSCAVSH